MSHWIIFQLRAIREIFSAAECGTTTASATQHQISAEEKATACGTTSVTQQEKDDLSVTQQQTLEHIYFYLLHVNYFFIKTFSIQSIPQEGQWGG